jgi:hypothetical protein
VEDRNKFVCFGHEPKLTVLTEELTKQVTIPINSASHYMKSRAGHYQSLPSFLSAQLPKDAANLYKKEPDDEAQS